MAGKNPRLVSIGIPTYNRAGSYLVDALRSATSQTHPAIEIIVADNCSTDHTEAYVKGLSDERIKYFRHPASIDPNDNFNFCLKQAEGDYFLLLHDDDCIDPDFAEACMNAAERAGDAGIIRTGVRTINESGRTLREFPNREDGLSARAFVEKWLRGQSMLILCSTLFNTARLKSIGGFGSRHNLYQDVAAEMELAIRHRRVDVEGVKASFRKHGGQRTNTSQMRGWIEDSIELRDRICDLLPEARESLRVQGNVHFSKHNYDLATGIPGVFTRYSTYAWIYKLFDYDLSPFKFFYDRAHNRIFTHLGKIKRKILGIEVATRSGQ
jgi:glycosyltransferase involved in cell wall biosynthesis